MINSNIPEFLANIDNLRHLVRYQTAPRVSSETVAEHSFFVSAYVLKLHDIYDFDLSKALSMAILHDFAEVFISDVPHPIKKQFPLIDQELSKAEYNVNKTYISSQIADWIEEFNNTTTVEGCIVALADILSVVSYSIYEIGLGNSKYMHDVLDKAYIRLNDMLVKCRQYARDIDNIENVENEVSKFIKEV